jgi:predicted GNAT family acetyltransferase
MDRSTLHPPDGADSGIVVTDNPAADRYEATVDGEFAVAVYRRHAGTITFTHTGVPPAIEGRGVANALARTALDAARRDGLRVVPLCPFFAAYVRRHPEYDDLRAP